MSADQVETRLIGAVAEFRLPRRLPGAALAPVPRLPPVPRLGSVSQPPTRTGAVTALLPARLQAMPRLVQPQAAPRPGAPRQPEMPSVGVLASLLADPAVTDVLVNGGEVWVDRGSGLIRCDVTVGSPAEVRRLAQRLAAACGRRLDEASPYVDARLPDGTRVHAVLPPIANDGPYLSLRTFRHRAFSLADLIDCGSLSVLGADLLTAIVGARLSYLVTGGTGCGKTTILTSMLGLVPHRERVVLVEDAPEIRPDHPHVVGLSARTANVEGAGSVTLRDLVRQALRMRPDRLVVGECRGAEVIDLLGALNTGHEGGAGTLHANTAADVPARLEALGLLSGVPRIALHAQIAAALQVIVHMRRMPTGASATARSGSPASEVSAESTALGLNAPLA